VGESGGSKASKISTYNRSDSPLQGSSGSTATVFIRWPYSLRTFDRVLRSKWGKAASTQLPHTFLLHLVIQMLEKERRKKCLRPIMTLKEEKNSQSPSPVNLVKYWSEPLYGEREPAEATRLSAHVTGATP